MLATTLKIIKILSIVSVAGCLGYDVLAAGPYAVKAANAMFQLLVV